MNEHAQESFRTKRVDQTMFRCDVCGRFVSIDDLVSGAAVRRLVTPDSHFTREEYETLCHRHKETDNGRA